MKVLVVTGGIGSGKTEVCRILADMGFSLQYDADRRVKMLYSVHPHLLDDIEAGLGCVLRDDDGNLVPSMLAEKIFSSSDSMRIVEELVFPALIEDFRSFCRKDPDNAVVVFESATVLEKPYFDGFGDYTVLVNAPFETRLARACSRDNADKEAILARMNNQKLMNALSEGYTDPRIDAVINNSGSFEELRIRTEETVSSLLKDQDIR